MYNGNPIFNFFSEDESDSSLGGSDYRSIINCNEDMLDIHDQRSFYFQISRDKDQVAGNHKEQTRNLAP
ncbi:hypothetical protein GQ457_02G004280 [Hibiscus cannabinus]